MSLGRNVSLAFIAHRLWMLGQHRFALRGHHGDDFVLSRKGPAQVPYQRGAERGVLPGDAQEDPGVVAGPDRGCGRGRANRLNQPFGLRP